MIPPSVLVETQAFQNAGKAEQAEMLVWLLHVNAGSASGVSIAEVNDAFSGLGIVKANVTRLKESFRKSRAIRTISGGKYAPTRDFSRQIESVIPQSDAIDETIFSVDEIPPPPFLSSDRVNDLRGMIRAYAHLFLLENSVRAFVEDVLKKKLGPDWWSSAANAQMKKKHSDREENEKKKKWAPTRSEFGPLYSLDWPDLITLIRKYETDFLPVLKDIKFLHRFEDLGMYRNVVAHNGVLREADDLTLIRIYYDNWLKQIK
jgi:hypothetical protein